MDMGRFKERHEAVQANSGAEYADIPRIVVTNGAIVRIVGDFASVWEHFINLEKGSRPFYCEGPESDCPLCAAANQLSYSDDKDQQELGTNSRAKEKFYFNALDRSPTGRAWHESNKKMKILSQSEKSMSVGSMLFKAIGDVVSMRTQQGQPDDPNGYDILLQKSGTGMKTRYGAQFTGSTNPLTEDEVSYDRWPLENLAKVSPRGERETAAAFLLGRTAPAQGQQAQSQAKPNAYAARGPVAPPQQAAPQQAAPQQAAARPQTGPRPASAPVKPVAAPAAAPARPAAPQAAPAKLVIPQKPSEHQDTTPRDGYDESNHILVPCSNCNNDMLIAMEDQRDLKCHSCGTIYDHPNKG
jgi:ribosomal protein S27E